MTRRILLTAAATLPLWTAQPAVAQIAAPGPAAPSSAQDVGPQGPGQRSGRRVRVDPYIEVEQILIVPLSDGRSDVITATGVAAGAIASVQTTRTQLSADVRYQHFFGYDDGVSDQDILTGIARGQTQLIPNLLTLEGGALASRTTFGGLGSAIGPNRLSSGTQVYSGYVGPQLNTIVNGIGLTAGYRLGYTRVEADGGLNLATGAPFGFAQESTSHALYAAASAQPGRLPFGWTVSSTLEREDSDPLDQRFDLFNVRADVTYPLTRTLAAVGSVGYEDIEVGRRPAAVDANGVAILDRDGRLQSAPGSARQLTYDVDGLIYDGGLLWRPTPRTSVEARVGHRYGGTIFTGAANWQFSRSGVLSVSVFDQVDTFGRSLTRSLGRLPTNFNVARGGFQNDLLGCVFGGDGGGGCLNPLSSAFAASSFRTRGVNANLSLSRGVSTFGVGGGYFRRSFDTPDFGPGATVDGGSDETAFLNAIYNTRLDRRQSFGLVGTASWYDPNLPGGVGGLFALSGEANYAYAVTNRLTATSALGLYYVDPDGFADQVTAAARLALRYGF